MQLAAAEAVHHLDTNMNAAATDSEREEGKIVVEAAAAAAVHHLDTDTNAAATHFEHEKMRFVVEAAAAPHSIGRAFAESIEFEYADGRHVVGAAAALDLGEDASTTVTATCALNEDTNAAAAAFERPKRRDAMSESQENKNEKTSEREFEIRSLVEERRNTAKGEKHKTERTEQDDQTMRQRRKKSETSRKIQQILEEFKDIKRNHAKNVERKERLSRK